MAHDIDILLATYNGGTYLREQLDSIVGQDCSSWRLIIRDDGSSDDTPAIIREYAVRYSDRITLLDDDGRNLGVIGNFSLLLENSTADYIMFCDQDDIWLPHKISMTRGMMQELDRTSGGDLPLLVFTDMNVVDEELRPLAASVWQYQQLDPRNGSRLNRLLLHNIPTGCTMMINRNMCNLAAPIPPEAVMHDWWLSLVAAAFGRSGFLAEPTVLYRQHVGNAIGAKPWSFVDEVRRFITPSLRAEIITRRDELLGRYRKQAELFLARYGTGLSPGNRAMVSAFANLATYTVFRQKYYILKYRFFYSNPLVTAGMILFRW